jgi:cation diffusion facilitator CzcD-associated flavoprotein CzcO
MRNRNVSIAIVGAGFSGIGLAIRLKEAGFTDITIFERAEGPGGVWRDNTYPGAACDAPSHLYSFSFAPKPDWSRRFAVQPEILAYLRDCVAHYGLYRYLRLRTEVTGAEFDPATTKWQVRTPAGDEYAFDLLVAACGQLSNPSVPDVPGIESFTGTMFHSARWDHAHDLAGARVAVVGNGASAVQFVPIVAPMARSLTIFQRESQWVGSKPDTEYPRWRYALNRRVPLAQRIPRLGIFLWFEVMLNPMLISPRGRRLLSMPVRLTCALARRSVRDKGLRRRVTPDYELGCKRILASSEYYDTLNRPNTEVVTEGIAKLTADGLFTEDGVHHAVDTIIWATGFRSQEFVAPMRVVGRSGEDLDEVWRGGARAHLGLAVPGFPNFFLMYGPNTNIGSGSVVYMLESQAAYIVAAARVLAKGNRWIDVRPEALERSDRRTQGRLSTTVWNQGGCESWYLDETRRNTNNWSGSMIAYRRRTRRLDLKDYVVHD